VIIPLLLRWKGVAVIVSYLLLGTFGLPVFADFSAGWIKWYGPSAGFLASFLIVSILLAIWNKNLRELSILQGITVFIVSHIFILLLGVNWILLRINPDLETLKLLLNLTPGLIVKSLIVSILYQKLLPTIKSTTS